MPRPEHPEDYRRLRNEMGVTQNDLAQLLGVHPMTVSKWERGILTADFYQRSLIESFWIAERNRPGTIRKAIHKMKLGGVGPALLVALYPAHPTTLGRAPQTDAFGKDRWREE